MIEKIRRKVLTGDYEFALPHFFEEMANDGLIFAQGRIARRFTKDYPGTRYEIVGESTDGRTIGVICRLKENGKVLFITTYELE